MLTPRRIPLHRPVPPPHGSPHRRFRPRPSVHGQTLPGLALPAGPTGLTSLPPTATLLGYAVRATPVFGPPTMARAPALTTRSNRRNRQCQQGASPGRHSAICVGPGCLVGQRYVHAELGSGRRGVSAPRTRRVPGKAAAPIPLARRHGGTCCVSGARAVWCKRMSEASACPTGGPGLSWARALQRRNGDIVPTVFAPGTRVITGRGRYQWRTTSETSAFFSLGCIVESTETAQIFIIQSAQSVRAHTPCEFRPWD